MVWVFRGMGLRQIPEPMAIPAAVGESVEVAAMAAVALLLVLVAGKLGLFRFILWLATWCSAAVGQKRRVKKKYPGGRSFCKTPLPKPAPDPDPGAPIPL